jgi:hypothetical protein
VASRAGTVTTKKRCCDSRPRCRTCPHVWERLCVAGWAVPTGKRRYEVVEPIPGAVVRLARKGRPRPLPTRP